MTGWNHNVHYHPFVLSQVPPGSQRALDVGCGRGALTRKVARLSREAVGIDSDLRCVDDAEASSQEANVVFVHGDVLGESLPIGSFDFITAVATLQHLQLAEALERFRSLLRPGGVLVIVGLYRTASPLDYTWAAFAMPISRIIRLLRGDEKVGAPIQEPRETLQEIRKECERILSGSVVRRRLFFRFSLVWRKSQAT